MLTVRLLGRFEVLAGDKPLPIPSRPVQALLAYLLLHAGEAIRREKLAGLLWPDSTEENARTNLRHNLWRLRKALAGTASKEDPDFIDADDATLSFNATTNYWLDVKALCQPTGADTSLETMREIVAAYGGPLLPGFYDDWILRKRKWLEAEYARQMQHLLQRLAEAGQWSEMVAWAERWLSLGNTPEPAYRALMLAYHQLGDQAGVVHAYRRCQNALQQDLGVSLSTQTQALYETLIGDQVQAGELTASRLAPEPAPGQPPYKGLHYFDVDDAAIFFGRARLTARLVAQLAGGVDRPQATRFLAVVGASGSGKSSLLRAGLIPTLSGRNTAADDGLSRPKTVTWDIHLFTPTAHPLEALALSLTREAGSVATTAALMDDLRQETRALHLQSQRLLSSETGRLLLVVDQFEELYVLCRDAAERRAFLDNLLLAARREGPTVVVIALRADFYAHCGAHAALRAAMEKHQVYIGPMSTAELRESILRPAEQGGWQFEPGLVDFLLQEVSDEPGALPLLSHALLETWRHRRGRLLTYAGYHDAGGVRGAIARTADRLFQQLDPEQQALARYIFLQLTALGVGTQDTRRPVLKADLLNNSPDPEGTAAVLEKLIDARLVTTHTASVEVAHEILIRAWPALRDWLEESRSELQRHRRLAETAEAWQAASKDASYLLRGTRLESYTAWSSVTTVPLTTTEQAFLDASTAAAVARQATETARRAHERHLEDRQRQFSMLLIFVLVLATISALVLATQAQQAREAAQAESLARATLQAHAEQETAAHATQQAEAERHARLAGARELALAAVNMRDDDPELSILLAMEAVNQTYAIDGTVLSEAENALHEAVQASRLELTIVADGVSDFVTFSADGSRLITGALDEIDPAGSTYVWDANNGALLYKLDGAAVQTMVAADDRFATLRPTADGALLTFWDLVSGAEIETIYLPNLPPARSARLSADGTMALFVLHEGGLSVWDLDAGRALMTLPVADDMSPYFDAAFSPDGQLLAAGDQRGRLTIWETATGRLRHQIDAHLGPIRSLLFTSAGNALFTAGGDGYTHLWNVETGEERLALPPHKNEVNAIALNRSNTSLATAGGDGRVKVWDLTAALGVGEVQEQVVLSGSPSGPWGVAFSPDGQHVAAVSRTTLRMWDISAGATSEGPVFVDDTAPGLAYLVSLDLSPDGTRLAVANSDTTPSVWDTRTGRRLFTLVGHRQRVDRIHFSPDGHTLVTVSHDNTIAVWDGHSGARLLVLEGYNCDQDDSLDIECDMAFSPHGRLLATGDATGMVTLLDFQTLLAAGPEATGIIVQRLDTGGQKVLAVTFSPDGRFLATGGIDKTITIWDAASGARLHTLAGHEDKVYCIAFSPDGSTLLSAGPEGLIHAWSVTDGQPSGTVLAHSSSILDLAFSPTAPSFATASYDGTVKVWSADGEWLELHGHDSGVGGLAFSPDGSRLYTASADGTVRTYLLDIEELMALARVRAGRRLTDAECQTYLHTEVCP